MYKYTYYIKCQLCQYNSLIALTLQVQISIFQSLVVEKENLLLITKKYPRFLPFMQYLSHFAPKDVFVDPYK